MTQAIDFKEQRISVMGVYNGMVNHLRAKRGNRDGFGVEVWSQWIKTFRTDNQYIFGRKVGGNKENSEDI